MNESGQKLFITLGWLHKNTVSGVGRRGADTVLPLPMAQVFFPPPPPKLFIRSTPGTDVTAFWTLSFSFGRGMGEKGCDGSRLRLGVPIFASAH